MRRGQKTSAQQMVLKVRQIGVRTVPGKSLAPASKVIENFGLGLPRFCGRLGGLGEQGRDRRF